jgi:hypothetical protein
MDDQQAIERYRYMLRTAPPDDIERAHAEAFSRLTPEQRQTVLRTLSEQLPPSEVPSTDDPNAMARMATRAELRDPGTMERTFSRVSAGPGLGGMFLSTLAGAFVGTAIASAFFDDQSADADTTGSDADADAGQDMGADADAGEFGGDFGGGDFGGGDFGGI